MGFFLALLEVLTKLRNCSILLSPITEPLPTCMFIMVYSGLRKDGAVNSSLLKLDHSVLSGLLILASLKQADRQHEK